MQSRNPRDESDPSLPPNRVAMRSVPQLPHMQGLCSGPYPEFGQSRRRVRPAPPDVATIGREKPGICRSFSEPSDGLEPSTPSLPSNNDAGTGGKLGKPRARKPSKDKESGEDE